MFTSQKKSSVVICGIYLVLLVWLVLFKFQVRFADLPHLRSINLIPFGEPLEVNDRIDVSESLYYILVFVPLGVYMGIFCPEWPLWKKVLPGFGLSLLLETAQYAFAIGASDITDILTNTLGTLLGVGLFAGFTRVWKEKAVTAVNAIGLTIAIIAFALIALVTLA